MPKKRKGRTIKVEEKKRPPKKPGKPRLGPPLRNFRPRKWPKELD